MKKSENIPELRFPEFNNEAGWQYYHGDKLFDQVTDKNHNSDLPILAITQDQGAVPRDEINYNVVVTEKSVESYKVVRKGDFIISLRSFQGGIEYSNYLGLCSPAYVILRKNREINDVFFKHYFKTNRFIADLTKNIEGLRDGKMVSYKQFSELLLPCPVPEEQQKIADCLSSLDDLLKAETEKLEALRAHKKGLMQLLFPAEGARTPAFRFPEFRGSGDWEEKRLGEMVNKVGSGTTPLGGNVNYISTGRPFVRSQNVGWGEFILDDIVYISEELHATSSSTEIENEDVLLNITGASIGRSAVADNRVVGGNLNQHVCIIRTKKGELNPVFLNQFLISKRGQRQIDSFQAGGNRQGLNFAQVRSFIISLPSIIEEQKKVADCLCHADMLITEQSAKLAQLRCHKKGLIQGLFPSSVTNHS